MRTRLHLKNALYGNRSHLFLHIEVHRQTIKALSPSE